MYSLLCAELITQQYKTPNLNEPVDQFIYLLTRRVFYNSHRIVKLFLFVLLQAIKEAPFEIMATVRVSSVE